MKKSISIFLFLLFFLGLTATAQSSLIAYLADGSTAVFPLTEYPQITFEGENLKVVAELETIELPRVEVKSIKFEESGATGVEKTPVEGTTIATNDNSISIVGLVDGCTLRVLSIAGQVVLSTTANNGSCSLSLAELANGIYIINYNNTTIKYHKK